MKLVHILAAGAMFAGSAYALEPIYDADSNAGRTTQYSYGPVSSVSVQTSSAHYLAAFITTNGQSSCTSAALYDEAGATLIAQLKVSDNKAVYGGVDAGFETLPKVLKLTCHDSNRSFLVHHKVPAAPSINYERALEFANWQPSGNRAPGYFADVTVEPQLAIDTYAADGQCSIVEFNASGPKLFNGAAQVSGIHSDFFSQSAQTDYHAYSASLIYGIKCSNAGGTTLLVDEWSVSEASQTGSLSSSYY
ncbi:hypothetical protein [Pseudoalteromonas luteoviolacea]|uniref:Uncharacterized protein n=1 Tax=Pseudoalteromonas luteoviolacea NCIMB 1942 TaxID=1365253 RepID=A0A162A417_9GAMM|nr:hypothetical protein [Pseudoalteromonas luteoviolacea]KZN43781.1 hypothetical protein N482_18295 [Pseudoalteromonas luteoviolacea NCIMB 1942]KZX01473.1 hypothetical protein JL49_04975 [Pseudoalteromonas luteoviolacea]